MKQTVQDTFDCRIAFSRTLVELAQADPRIIAVCNDSVGSSNLGEFRQQFPDRLINVGIAEQNMVGVAAGLANGGLIPFVCAAGSFLSARALEQIKVDLAYSAYPAVLCAMSPGMAYGELGPTHHSIEDISWMRAIANLDIVIPADPEQTIAAVRWAAFCGHPVYLRIGRFKVPSISEHVSGAAFTPGKIDTLRLGDDITLVATGSLVSRALQAADLLQEEGIDARVLNVSTIRPLDSATLHLAAEQTQGLVIAEEGVSSGGLGAAVAMELIEQRPVKIKCLGVNSFAPTGSTGFLLDHFGLNAEGMAQAARDILGRS